MERRVMFSCLKSKGDRADSCSVLTTGFIYVMRKFIAVFAYYIFQRLADRIKISPVCSNDPVFKVYNNKSFINTLKDVSCEFF